MMFRMLASWDELLMNAEETVCNEEVPQRRFITKLIRIPTKSIGTVVGKGGANVRRIEFETKTFIRIVYTDKNSAQFRKTVSHELSGNSVEDDWSAKEKPISKTDDGVFVEIRAESEERIRLACLAIRGLVADSLTPQITRHICAEPHAIGSIIGKDGCNLKRLQRNFRVRVEIDSHTCTSLRKISITGTEESVALAEIRITQLISRGRQAGSNPLDDDDVPFEQVTC
ncbi:hypothetical protein Y032_0901g2957 [Ancylostoma ceylanicum]|uniref:K Homology domain-containing protein n=2 Tax=Ancylostoma ceylanicum TaxID=53326 RepID=A0A016W9U4_9BILA|nr:hypothetical protein Y032_0901g2957 [Ancylostoma ceylanicum]